MDKISPPLYKAMGLSSNIVYLRQVELAELPSDLLEQVDSAQQLYAVYHEDGEQIALIESVSLAKDLAEEHRFELHQVH